MVRKASEMLGTSTLLWILVAVLAASPAIAADIMFLSAGALEPVMEEVIPAFERSSGNKVMVTYGAIGGNTDRIRKGEAFDVAIASEPQIEGLSREGKIAAGSAAKFAKVDIGVATRKGGPKPDISSADALKRALVAAKAIVVNDPATGSAVSTHLFAIFEREGIAAEMKAKTKLAANNSANFDAVAKGEVDFGFAQSNSIGEDSRIELVGSPPAPYGNSTSIHRRRRRQQQGTGRRQGLDHLPVVSSRRSCVQSKTSVAELSEQSSRKSASQREQSGRMRLSRRCCSAD